MSPVIIARGIIITYTVKSVFQRVITYLFVIKIIPYGIRITEYLYLFILLKIYGHKLLLTFPESLAETYPVLHVADYITRIRLKLFKLREILGTFFIVFIYIIKYGTFLRTSHHTAEFIGHLGEYQVRIAVRTPVKFLQTGNIYMIKCMAYIYP